ncbi:hypothetical protein FMUND_7773 [Fusarium mundagurra]|uniref:Uncharacterized protein n=1 Tax=Fusarium mundagurra TaxID=1567541 RepID=A0A8H5YKE6_9HYPO|nr:hypothetical protein FMUND_7773 [Fusarium mundagurra]
MAPGNRSSGKTSDPFAPDDDPFARHTGNIKAKVGESAQNAIGMGQNAILLAKVVKTLVYAENTPEMRLKARSILMSMGGVDGLINSVTTIETEQAPEPAVSQIDRVIREAHHPGSSASGRFNDSPAVRKRKRRATEPPEPDSDEELLAMFDPPRSRKEDPIPVIPRPWPATPYIVADSSSTGKGRKAILSLIAADECMIFMSEDAARIFGELFIHLRKEVAEDMPLSAAAQMAGIDKSLVLSFDMPLYLPKPDSTAVAEIVRSTADINIFNDEADTRRLAQETIAFMESQSWQPSTGLDIRHSRLFYPAGAFVQMEVVADKLTHLGRVFKPLLLEEGRKWPQVIAADDARQLDWDAYDQIGQPPEGNALSCLPGDVALLFFLFPSLIFTIKMANEETKGIWFNPTVIDDDEQVKLEDAPLTNNAAVPNNATVTNVAPVT